MKVVTVNNDHEKKKITSLLSNLKENKLSVTVWQSSQDKSGSKLKYIVKAITIADDKISFISRFRKSFAFEKRDIFFFCYRLNFIFKAVSFEVNEGTLTVPCPEKVTLLETIESTKFSEENEIDVSENSNNPGYTQKSKTVQDLRSLDDDANFSHMREAPRSKTGISRKVTVSFLSKTFTDKEFGLFDLSQGGAAILVKDTGMFTSGDNLEITHVDGKEINPKLKGIVRSIRDHNAEKDEFKVGLQFL